MPSNNVTLRLPDWRGKLRRRGPAVLRNELRAVADETVTAGRRQWPVDSGDSRDAFKVTTTKQGARVINNIGYARFIRGGRTWRAFVALGNAIKRRHADRIADALGQAVVGA